MVKVLHWVLQISLSELLYFMFPLHISIFSLNMEMFLFQAYLRESAEVYLRSSSPRSTQPQSPVSDLLLHLTIAKVDLVVFSSKPP